MRQIRRSRKGIYAVFGSVPLFPRPGGFRLVFEKDFYLAFAMGEFFTVHCWLLSM
jgi:hypothetical protein